jgi:metallo-beta-lactamase family protein
MLTLTSHGAAGEVTGSKHVLDTGDARLLVDCGVFQGRRELAHQKNEHLAFDARAITASINTHGHLDHCGSYPLLVKRGFRGRIYATGATADIARLVMEDSARLQASDARFLEKRQQRNPAPWRKVFPAIYDDVDVAHAVERYRTVPYGQVFEPAPGLAATLHDAGHILGSAVVRLEVATNAGPVVVGFTGDLGRKNTPILRDPESLGPVDWLVSESTYGDRLHDEAAFASDELAQVINETLAKGGRVLIPAFAIGRTQELIVHLHQLFEAGRIPPVPVFVDSPMASSATQIFRDHPECYDAETVTRFLDNGESPFAFDNLRYVRTPQESKGLNSLAMPCVIVSASGMCEGGRILHHLLNGLPDPRNTVVIVGYMGEHTLGRALADKRREVRVFGEPVEVRARVKILNAFSAHADQAELTSWITALDRTRLKGVLLVHGEPKAQAGLTEKLLAEGVPRVEALREGVPVEL